MSFIHLHTHSDFSLLNGLAKIDDLLDAAEKDGMHAIALTDKNAVYGAVDFVVKAKERDIKAIIGAEILVTPSGMDVRTNTPSAKKTNQLVLLVENEAGYKNLLKIVTTAQLDGYYIDPRVDYAVLREHSAGLIALSGNGSGEVPEKIARDDYKGAKEKALLYNEIFGAGNFYLELNHHPLFPEQKKINDGIIKLALETGIPLVAAGDVYYIDKSDRDTHDVLTCIQMNRKVDEGDRPNYKHLDLSFRTEDEMSAEFGHLDGAIENTAKIADRCNFAMEVGNTKLPYFPLPDDKTADELLRDLCLVGLAKRFPGEPVTDVQNERMDYELSIIEKTGYASYFLIVQDFTNWAKAEGIIVGPGRGSAAGSFVSYLTGITNMDPIEYKLLFERFLNPERVSMPDVDMDFADDRRDDVLEYVRKTYGADHVAQIITFGTMAARAAIRDAGRALNYGYDFCDKISKLIPMFSSIEKALSEVPDFGRLYRENADATDLIDTAKRLEGLNRHSSVHACGVVITDKPVVEYTALQRVSGDDEALVTQYASSTKFSAVEKIGLLKMDFLGLKNLTIIQNTIRIVKRIHGVTIDIEHIPLDDAEAYKLLQEGRTTGVFQLESSGMRRYLKQLKPSVLEDIIAMVALYRPGPMEWIPDFIDGKHGIKEVTYLDPRLENILQDTYGVAVYQEQVMRIAQDLAGFTLGEADILRKAMGKKILALIKEQRIKFVEGSVNNGITKEIAEEIFAFIEPFAGYGFNRSHAACYALIGYQTAYLKAYYPAEFMAALMTSDQGNTDRIAIEASECRDMQIDVLPPSVNESFLEFAVIYSEDDVKKENPRIRFGLGAIKNVGGPVAQEIVAERLKNGPYTDLTSFCERIKGKDLNKRSLVALAMVGAFDDFAERNAIIQSMETILAFVKSRNNASETQGSLFASNDLSRPMITLKDVPEALKANRLTWEKTLLGLYVSDHPATEYAEFFKNMCTPLANLTEDIADKKTKIGGIVTAISTILLKSGKNMSFVTLEDGTSSIECLVFPKLLAETQLIWEDGRAVVISGHLSAKDGELKFLADGVEEISHDQKVLAKRVQATSDKHNPKKATPTEKEDPQKPYQKEGSYIITLPENNPNDIIEKVKVILETCESGPTRIFLIHNQKKMKTAYSVLLSDNHKLQIESILK